MNEESLKHYYGDKVRMLFVLCGVIMVVSYPFFGSIVSVPLAFSIVGCIILALLAGFMNPKQKWVIVASIIVSVVGFGVFEYFAIDTYLNLSHTKELYRAFFWTNQILAIFFFFAAYFSTKSFRGLVLSENNKSKTNNTETYK